ncbi:glycosyltransferase [Candidatus Saccharibacteria bacterium]|nr:glycosyltransferase [Candidatus Saccharibacteria bacterium]MCL1963123.1 glycosyltransferase [Candidatus Saccharibacteria bacterium]
MKKYDKVAIVCDWLTEIGGAERVLKAVCEIFPDAPIYTSQYRPKRAVWFRGHDVRTGWLNIFPAGLRRFMPFFRNLYFGHLDLSKYDLVISIANAEVKGVKTRSDAVHISYLQGPPTQYYWGLYDQYLKNPGFGALNFLARWGLKLLVKPLRKTDYKFAQKPDFLIANSDYVKDEIKKYYGRDAATVHPNVDVERIRELAGGLNLDSARLSKDGEKERNIFLIAGRQVSWKRVDLAIVACIKTGDELLVIGDGPEHKNLVKLARGHDNIKFLPKYNGAAEIVQYFRSARAFLFPSLEPFGITPIEALATGTPVIALKRGGALDFIQDGKNGVFFDEQNVDSLVAVIKKFGKMKFDSAKISMTAREFSEQNFKENFSKTIEKCVDKKGRSHE